MSLPSSSDLPGRSSVEEGMILYSETHGTQIGRTAAEKMREKKLRDDPMVLVIGPSNVECRRCCTPIKLSDKSLFDHYHWTSHRRRCLKKPPGMLKRRGPQAKSTKNAKHHRAVVDQHRISPAKEESVSISLSPSVDPQPPLLPVTTPSHQPSLHFRPETFSSKVFEDYLFRAGHKNSAALPTDFPRRQEWNWSQLVPPKFIQRAPIPNTEVCDGDRNSYTASDFVASSEAIETFWITASW
ncbi:hypothetical protein Hypma_014217 [Hypsizygus marmoreus]|uniref:Uncharacterized protein n=1 Tax=Hypsizygus marmoreus TaxID=39966 RepID=A0A369JD62_HYPMA|nr:hypothetical protein Hypma_014217 [Hypsizygus marmoreus]